MKLQFLLLLPFLLFNIVADSKKTKFIRNIDFPACKNCIHYKSNNYNFISPSNRCEKFGNKDIVTDKISYDCADLCRSDESKCGKEGKFFIKEKNIHFKIFLHKLSHLSPIILYIFYCLFLIYLKTSV
jgi:hypothetical protein